MDEILTDLTSEKLALANEKNIAAWIPHFGKLGKVTRDDPPGVTRAVTPFTTALFNSIVETRLSIENVEDAITYLTADARRRNIPLLWWVGPSTQPADLAVRLQQHGFYKDDDGPGMGIDLDQMNTSLPVPEGLSIQRVILTEDVESWCQAVFVGFEAPPARIGDAVEAWSSLLRVADAEKIQPYLARLNGEPVATSLLALGAGVAGIYAVATAPGARRMGIGAQVTLHPLLRARELGYKAGILQASEMGERMYCSLGFKEVCRITSYRYTPSGETGESSGQN